MASNLFTRAKAYVKTHPRTTYQDAIKLLSAKSKKVSGAKKAKPAARKVGKAKPAGISTRSKSHTDKNKITANIQIGRVKLFKMGDIHNDLMNKYKQAIFSVSRLNDDIAYMQFDIKQDPAKRKTLAPKIRTAKKQLTEARAIMAKIRKAINS